MSLVCAALLCGGTAFGIDLHVGYCDGMISTDGQSKVGNATVSAAVKIAPKDLEPYAGSRIVGIRIGLANADYDITDLCGWVASGLDGEHLMEAHFDGYQAGWNTVRFDEPKQLSATDTLVVGYTFNQTKSARLISVAGLDTEDGFWIAKNGAWENKSGDVVGSLSVELVVSSPEFPTTDLSISSVDINPVVKHGDIVTLHGSLQNISLTDIRGYKVHVSVGEASPIVFESDALLRYQERTSFGIDIPTGDYPLALGLPVTLEVFAEDDGRLDNNIATTEYSCYDDSLPRRILFEEFTTEKCGNCPRAIEAIAECMANGYEEKTVLIAHHVGYYTDWLTVDEDKEFLWLYTAESGTFAPGGAIDRTHQPGNTSHPGPVNSIGYADSVYPQLDWALSVPSFVSVQPTAEIDDDRNLSVVVDMERMPIFAYQVAEPRLSVILTEDSIRHHSQAGYSAEMDFHHMHVYRKSLNENIWGDPIVWDGDRAQMTFSAALPDDYDVNHLKVVAFVNNYNPKNLNDSKVYNANDCKPSVKTGIKDIDADDNAAAPLYNIMGVPVKGNYKGIVIRRGKKIIDSGL